MRSLDGLTLTMGLEMRKEVPLIANLELHHETYSPVNFLNLLVEPSALKHFVVKLVPKGMVRGRVFSNKRKR